MVEFTKTYNLKPPTAETNIRPSAPLSQIAPGPATPHPFFQRGANVRDALTDDAHRLRFNSLLNAAAQKLTQAD